MSVEKQYHGFAIHRIIEILGQIDSISFRIPRTELSRSGYILEILTEDGQSWKVGLLIKHSTARRSPWTFTFTHDHQTEVQILYEECDEIFVLLMTETVGVACLSHSMLKEVLDDNHEETEWIRIRKRLRSQYEVTGKDGKLTRKLALKAFPEIIKLYVEEKLEVLSSEKDQAPSLNNKWYKFWK